MGKMTDHVSAQSSFDVVILAAGKGTRMKSKLPKVLHQLNNKPMVLYSVEAATAASGRPPVLVVGFQEEVVRKEVDDAARYVRQQEQLGTGHAVMQARDMLKGKSTHIAVIYADMPLLRSETLAKLHQAQIANTDGPFSMLTLETDTPRGFGRIIRGEDGTVKAIVEEAAATDEQKLIREVNVGIYCFDAGWLWEHLDAIPLSAKGEYYLTDLVEIAVDAGGSINALTMEDPTEGLGVNTRVHLSEAEAAIRTRINEAIMLSGVTMIDPSTTYIHPDVQIGQDTVIYPNTYLLDGTTIGEDCVIGPNCYITGSIIGDRCVVKQSTLEYATLEADVDAGPYARLRKGAYLESGVHMGNFGEVKNSRLRQGVAMGHFSYIGDADIGAKTNIGAGTITANYDGKNKNKTIVGEHAFIGSDTVLIAPVVVGDNAIIGAGSVVTKDVAAESLVYGVPAKPPSPSSKKSRE